MTDEYKIETLNYLLGNITPTQSDDSEIFLEQEEISRDEWLPFLPSDYLGFRFEGMVAANEMTSGLTVLYGGYSDHNWNPFGIIVLVDENFKPVKTILKRDTGNDLRYIQYMKQAEDGTFYYIDSNSFTFNYPSKAATSSQETRFIMTNNFTIKDAVTNDYVLRYRKWYYFGSSYKNFYCKNMFKDPNSANYIFFGSGADKPAGSTIWSWRNLRIIGLKINVGSDNVWTSYVNETNRLFGSAFAVFESGNPKFRCVSSATAASSTTIDMTSNYGGSINTFAIATFSYHPYVDDYNYKKQSVFIDVDTVYFVQSNQRWGISGTANAKHIGLYKYVVPSGTLTEIYHKSLGNYDFCDKEAIYIDRCDTDLYIQYNTNIANNKADYYFQRLVNDTWSPILIGTQKSFFYSLRTMFVKSNFNLLQIYLYAANPRKEYWFYWLIKEDYNSYNYNGTPYIDYDSLISEKGQIYSNDKLVFARNLYNKTSNGGTTVSTIQIPNNYLNGIQLDLKKLISQTNLDINNDTNITDKNIYEMVFVNYINTIQVIDEDTNTLIPSDATYINTNINTGTSTNYGNTKIGKVKINYSTPVIDTLVWQKMDDTHYQTTFSVSTTEIPSSIEFLSNDETTTYLTKTFDLEQNKTYVINQKIRIE